LICTNIVLDSIFVAAMLGSHSRPDGSLTIDASAGVATRVRTLLAELLSPDTSIWHGTSDQI
jgi:hypothetical protein